MPPCNCGKKRANVQFVYTSPSGQQVAYRTEVEARAAVSRNGGTYRVA